MSIFIYSQTYFVCGCTIQRCRHVPLERGWDTGVGRSTSIQPKSKTLFESPAKLNQGPFWEPQWSNFQFVQKFNHFDKVAVRLVQLFLLDLRTSIFIYSQTYFVCGYTMRQCWRVPLERGWDTGVGRSTSIQPKSKTLFWEPSQTQLGTILGATVVKFSFWSKIQSLWQSCCQISSTLSFSLANIHFYMLANILCLWVHHAAVRACSLGKRVGGIQVLAGPPPSSQKVRSFFESPAKSNQGPFWEPQWSNFQSGQKFKHFDKVAVKLGQLFLLDLRMSIFIYLQTYFVCGYSTLLGPFCSYKEK